MTNLAKYYGIYSNGNKVEVWTTTLVGSYDSPMYILVFTGEQAFTLEITREHKFAKKYAQLSISEALLFLTRSSDFSFMASTYFMMVMLGT